MELRTGHIHCGPKAFSRFGPAGRLVSAFRVLTRIPSLPFDKFPNYKNIRHVHSPVLIMHSHADSVIAFWHGQKMFNLANQPKQAFWP